MRLSHDTVYYLLSRKFSNTQYIKRVESMHDLKRPVFYEKNINLSDHVVVIRGCEMANLKVACGRLENTLVICAGDCKYKISPVLPVISVNASVEQIFNELQVIFDTFDDWDTALNTCCEENVDFSELINCSEPVLFHPLAVADSNLHFIAFSNITIESGLAEIIADTNDDLLIEYLNDFHSDKEFADLYQLKDVFRYPVGSSCGAYMNIFHEDEYKARIIVKSPENDEAAFRYYTFILKHLSIYIERYYSKYLSFDRRNQTSMDNLRSMLCDCVAGNKVRGNLWDSCFNDFGWTRRKRLQLVQFDMSHRYDKNEYIMLTGKELESQWKGCVCFSHNDHFLLLINRELFSDSVNKDSDFYQALAYFLRDNLLVAGLSREFSDMQDLKAAFGQTKIAIEFGQDKNPSHWYHKFDDYAMAFILASPLDNFEAKHICNTELLALKRYDQDNDSELYNTLLCYFKCKFNAVAAAKQLYIHRTSFLKRMEKIKKLINIDLSSVDDLLYLSLSFKIIESMN